MDGKELVRPMRLLIVKAAANKWRGRELAERAAA
jgi:hypothetical protein